ncbi:DUF2254 domain-containing protein [Actinocorallia sp. B10E7]|uniref:DUF2254 domain-containing protein n=1 Tax=Actinocorallia sp. B10E7 TaxID=3153558 RepID=UPI00325E64EC
MRLPIDRSLRAERSRTPLWLWPVLSSMAGFAAAVVSVRMHERGLTPPVWARWHGDSASARTLLQAVAGSVITVTGLTFSLTVVALQLASQQFSPRLLREFTRDPVIKAVLSALVSTFVFTTVTLRYIQDGEPAPNLAMFVASLLSMVALVAVLGFLTHLARLLRVDTMMLSVHDQTDRMISTYYPAYEDERPRSPGATPPGGTDLRAETSGFVQLIVLGPLLRTASAHDLAVEVTVRPGDHVVKGTPIATVWSGPGREPDLEEIGKAVREGIEIGYERTIEQDVAFGFRQLTDIAVKALSPGVNDPVTAAHAIGHVADLMVRLTGRRLGATLHSAGRGEGRVVIPDRDLEYYLELVCGPIRRYGRHEPAVLNALLRMLRDVAVSARDDGQREQIAFQTDLVVAGLPSEPVAHDTEQVEDMVDRVRHALNGDLRSAYRDRSGETRSI